jgi:hypothetical protein
MRPVLVVIAAFALIAALLACGRWLAGRRWIALGHAGLACAAAAVVAGGWPLSTYLGTYEPLVDESPVAELFLEQTGSNRFRAKLTRLPMGRMQVVELVGDQWRVDLTTLEWTQGASQLGLASRYRLERLASRLESPDEPAVPSGATHELARPASRPTLADLGTRRGPPLLAQRELTGTWQPMAHGARFDLRLSAGGDVTVDPLNPAASDSLATR